MVAGSIKGKKPVAKKISRFRKIETRLVMSVGLFVLAVLLSRGSDLNSWEKAIFNAIYGLPEYLYPFFIVITQLGGVGMAFILVMAYLIIRHYAVAIRLLMSGSLAYLLAGVAKDVLGRARPHELIDGVVVKDYLIRGSGFPSGHVAMVAALALVAVRYLPRRYKWVAPAAIIGVALSRIYLGAHAPLDVVGGFAIGWFCAEIFGFVRITDIRPKEK